MNIQLFVVILTVWRFVTFVQAHVNPYVCVECFHINLVIYITPHKWKWNLINEWICGKTYAMENTKSASRCEKQKTYFATCVGEVWPQKKSFWNTVLLSFSLTTNAEISCFEDASLLSTLLHYDLPYMDPYITVSVKRETVTLTLAVNPLTELFVFEIYLLQRWESDVLSVLMRRVFRVQRAHSHAS